MAKTNSSSKVNNKNGYSSMNHEENKNRTSNQTSNRTTNCSSNKNTRSANEDRNY